MAHVVDGLDAAHRAVGLPGSSHAESALARRLDLVVAENVGIVQLCILELHDELGRGFERCGALLWGLDHGARGHHPRRSAGEASDKDGKDRPHDEISPKIVPEG